MTTDKSRADALTEITQFLTDVVTAAGLLSYGRTDKKLATRIGEHADELRKRMHLLAASPVEQPAAVPAHKPNCASLNMLLLTSPPKPAPCDCGAAAPANRHAAFEWSEAGADAAREYLVRHLRAAVGNDTFTQYIRSELAGDFALAIANARAASTDNPAGWILVPVQPTGVMKDAGHWALPVGVGGPWTAAAVYQAMIDTAPPPKANGDDSGGAQ
ncbi:hypothetical protein H3O04_11565 [Burkholderia sp. KCJ3K979]|uniref:hypothetical protein n=1 Tax=Burkholderia sp. KCJ3K979 TaxID=2759149 RepID=UPI00192A007A|nr:hypothetical protein [Burkholderia sp. KCJ3K979]MBL3963137.1 hypothetical protein [Burkholderia sp. KCJ3K979]